MSAATCTARHPITREACVIGPAHNEHVSRSGKSWFASVRSAQREHRERVKGRRGRDAREWGWTEAQR